jgi:hypothetical protein
MKAPQIVFIVLHGIRLVGALLNHRELKAPEHRKYNFWTTLVEVAIVTGLVLWGGFFK